MGYKKLRKFSGMSEDTDRLVRENIGKGNYKGQIGRGGERR